MSIKLSKIECHEIVVSAKMSRKKKSGLESPRMQVTQQVSASECHVKISSVKIPNTQTQLSRNAIGKLSN